MDPLAKAAYQALSDLTEENRNLKKVVNQLKFLKNEFSGFVKPEMSPPKITPTATENFNPESNTSPFKKRFSDEQLRSDLEAITKYRKEVQEYNAHIQEVNQKNKQIGNHVIEAMKSMGFEFSEYNYKQKKRVPNKLEELIMNSVPIYQNQYDTGELESYNRAKNHEMILRQKEEAEIREAVRKREQSRILVLCGRFGVDVSQTTNIQYCLDELVIKLKERGEEDVLNEVNSFLFHHPSPPTIPENYDEDNYAL